MLLDHPKLDWQILERFHFDRARFLANAGALAEGRLTDTDSVVRGRIEAADAVVVADLGSDQHRALGEALLRRGGVAHVILNGGMATRFGGVVKGTVEVFDGESFLSLKAADARRAATLYGAAVPVVLMNSFATDAKTADHVAARGGFGLEASDLLSFHQTISVRLNEDGTLFETEDGGLSYYAPGHGDFFPCIRASGILQALRQRGVEVIFFSNVDNLGASVDPAILGHHLASGNAMTVEVTAKAQNANGVWDKGGAPARVDGRIELVEGFRMPETLAPELLPDFSTNTFMFDVEALEQEFRLDQHLVRKVVGGRTAIQFESIACEGANVRDAEGSPLLPLTILRVPRGGPAGRFYPVKTREDLIEMKEILRARCTPAI